MTNTPTQADREAFYALAQLIEAHSAGDMLATVGPRFLCDFRLASKPEAAGDGVNENDIKFITLDPNAACLLIHPRDKELLRLMPDGTVVADDALSATEAGRYFVQALIEHWPLSVAGVIAQAEERGRRQGLEMAAGTFAEMLGNDRWKSCQEMRSIVGGDEVGDYQTVMWKARHDVDTAFHALVTPDSHQPPPDPSLPPATE